MSMGSIMFSTPRKFVQRWAGLTLAIVTMSFASPLAHADALIVNRAMQAGTICEIFVDEGAIRVELEIGTADLAAFGSLLPDALRQRLGLEPQPLAERVQHFLDQEWIVRGEDAQPLSGDITRIEAKERIRRDPITGEPIEQSAEDRELVLFVELLYLLETRPGTISVAPLIGDGGFAAANIGFVVYHDDIAVNDFRYLSQPERLQLDWEDPWYSAFENRNLRRQYYAPLSGFLYVDQFEVRKEIIVRPKDLQHWVDLGLREDGAIPVEDQVELKQHVAAFLTTRNSVTIDGRTIEPELDRIHFVRRTLRTTGVIDPPEDLHADSAVLGVIFVYPITGLPDTVTMSWDMFSPRIGEVPAVATDDAGGMPTILTTDDPVLLWRNFFTKPPTTSLASIATPTEALPLRIPVLSAILFAVSGILALRAWRHEKRGLLVASGIALAAVVASPLAQWNVSNPFVGHTPMTGDESDAVVLGLLKNVYRAFDYRDENAIYDTLERSADGDLLTQIYLETRRSLELKNQGGARAKMKDVELLEASVTDLDDGAGFVARCSWVVAGSVGHWGHIHQRRNQYEAILTIQPIDGVWKITDLELLNEQRL